MALHDSPRFREWITVARDVSKTADRESQMAGRCDVCGIGDETAELLAGQCYECLAYAYGQHETHAEIANILHGYLTILANPDHYDPETLIAESI